MTSPALHLGPRALRELAADRALVQGLLNGDPAATERLHAVLAVLVRPLGRRFRLSKMDQQDVVAEIERRLQTNSADRLQNFSYRCRLEEWLGIVALNVVRDRAKSDRRRERRERFGGRLMAVDNSLPEYEQLIERLGAEADVAFASADLEPLTRQVLELRFVVGLPWVAIGLLTGLSESAVTSRAYRAIEGMSQRLAARDATYATHKAEATN